MNVSITNSNKKAEESPRNPGKGSESGIMSKQPSKATLKPDEPPRYVSRNNALAHQSSKGESETINQSTKRIEIKNYNSRKRLNLSPKREVKHPNVVDVGPLSVVGLSNPLG